jgi:hypothetical protein
VAVVRRLDDGRTVELTPTEVTVEGVYRTMLNDGMSSAQAAKVLEQAKNPNISQEFIDWLQR